PKGDLTNLCLTFPALQPADFRPWIDERQAATEGLTPDGFAAEQAEAWSKGLAGWGLAGANIATLQSATDFTIYTPGSRSGVPVDIVGSLQVPADTSDAELVGDEIEGYVSGLLGLVGIGADPLTSREHILLTNLIAYAWGEGRALDLPILVGMVGNPPIRKLGVFELDQFFPQDARMELALKLNGLLAAPSFAAWADGPPLDIGSMLYTADGNPRCAIVTTAHLSDEERQFVTALVLSKLVTWMRRQSGTSELRAVLYMDEVTGYLPPTANPPTKKPIMTLMKQARAFGLGVVLATQNPVDIDYKALSNAGTWMIGRLQTERDKQRLSDGLSSASGVIDVAAVASTISGLAKREFVLRRAGRDSTEVFTTRWAMSYLRGPMTRDQIAAVMADRGKTTADARAASAEAPSAAAPQPSAQTAPDLAHDETTVMPQVADGVAVRWIDVAAPWLAEAGGEAGGTRLEPVVVARVRLRYDDTKAGLAHDQEYECVLSELTDPPDPSRAIAVDYDDRDLRTEPQSAAVYRIATAPLDSKAYFGVVERGLRDHLTRNLSIELSANPDLKLYGRPGESPTDFAGRCEAVADDKAAAEIATLRDKYEAKATRIRDAIAGAQDRLDVLQAEAEGKRNDELLSTAGSILGDLLGGRSRSRTLRSLGSAARSRGRTAASRERVEAAQGKVGRLHEDLADLEAELLDEIAEIDAKWQGIVARTTTISVGLERTDVQIAGIVLAWMPVA
ncbi:MAG TPA: hypothetical protein VF065_13375, partial [Ilumatobacter sp.]